MTGPGLFRRGCAVAAEHISSPCTEGGGSARSEISRASALETARYTTRLHGLPLPGTREGGGSATGVAAQAQQPPHQTFPGPLLDALGTGTTAAIRHAIYCMVTEEQIEKWADEAEVGYDVAELKRRGRGRPGRGTEPMQVVAVRLTAEEIASLDAIADREHLTRSEAIRRALADFAA